MNADPDSQLRLLELQAADTALAQLRHRRASLPELAAILAATERANTVRAQAIDIRTGLDDLAADQRRLENDIDTVRTRALRDNARLVAGGVPSKELEGLQHELVSLARRQSTLEDELLEILEQRESAETELGELDRQLAQLDAERTELEQHRDDQFADIDDAAAQRTQQRALIAANGGVGAAALRHRRCEGCHLELAGSELTTVRTAAPDAVLRCENCRRILIRTPESGL